MLEKALGLLNKKKRIVAFQLILIDGIRIRPTGTVLG
jgi:hypothetical protein